MKEKYPLFQIVDSKGQLINKAYKSEVTEKLAKSYYIIRYTSERLTGKG